jgi:Ser/Thr protein kinase RdoA (MazF antagonist)
VDCRCCHACSVTGQLGLVSISDAELLASNVASGLGLGPCELIRSGANHVFRTAETVIRVSPPNTNVEGQVALARHLLLAGLPVAAPLGEPIRTDSAGITIWERVRATDQPIDFRQLGKEVAKLHSLDIHEIERIENLPSFDSAPWLQIETNLAALHGAAILSPKDFSILRLACEKVRGWGTVRDGNRLVACHGDVHPQNVLMRDGQVVIIDWDTICLGPPEWDHIALLTWSERWGGDRSTYGEFAAGYGNDFTSFEPAFVQMQVRLLAPTINLATRTLRNANLAGELERRMQYWRGIDAPPHWTPQ